jgi:signal transduction histidine kinase/CheY-like chemotaxis protein
MIKKILEKINASILKKTIIQLAVPIILFLIFYSIFTYNFFKVETDRNYQNELRVLSFNAASHLSGEMKKITNIVKHSVHHLNRIGTLNLDSFRTVLLHEISQSENIYGAGIFLKDKTLGADTTSPFIYIYKRTLDSLKELNYIRDTSKEFDYKNAEWWINSVDSLLGNWTKPYFDPFGKTFMVTYSFPLFYKDRIIGSITADVQLQHLVYMAVKPLKGIFSELATERFLIITQDDNTVIYSPNKNVLGRTLSDLAKTDNTTAKLVKVLLPVIEKQQGITTINYKGEDYYLFYASTHTVDWVALSWVPVKDIEVLVFNKIKRSTALIAGFFLFLLLIIFILVKKFTKPVLVLSEASIKIAQGDYNTNIGSLFKFKDELGTLARNFDQMRINLLIREDKLKEANDNFVNLLNSLPFSVLQFDREFKPIFFNKFAIKLLLDSVKDKELDIKQKKWSETINEKYQKEIKKAVNGKKITLKGYDLFHDNEWFINPFKDRFIELIEVPIFVNNRVDSIIAIIFDMTEEKQNEELRIEVKSAELASKAKGEFLARMSHEIRTPLNAVIGFADLALRKYDHNDQIKSYLSKIKQSANHLLGLINDILDYSKIEAGKIELEEIEFDIESILLDLFDLATSIAHKKDLEFIISHSPLIPTPLYGDPLRLKQVVLNLVSNAIKFTEKGEIHVNVDVKSYTRDKVKLLFSVKDTGIGLSKEKLELLFQPFVQADGSITRRFGGTGIGLTISKKLVRLMNGEIWVESEEGKGSTFYFTAEFKTKETSRNFLEYFEKFEFSNDIRDLNVLICDDNQTTLKIINTILQAFKYKTTMVDNGNDVVKLLEEGNTYDLLIIDKVMPHPDGLETMSLIMKKGLRKKINRVILLSAYEIDDDQERFEELGIDISHSKPVSYSNLFDKIITVFNKDKSINVKADKKKIDELSTFSYKIKNNLVLIVDDNDLNREVLGDLIEIIGLKAEFASNGKEAVEKIRSSGNPSKYNIVFMDIQMPKMDGYQATKLIREMEEYNDLPIVAMTADVMPGVKEACFASGMNDYITKPIDPQEVAITITKWVEKVKIKKKSKTVSGGIMKLEHIDVKEGIARIGGNEKRFIKLLCKFQDYYHDFPEKLMHLETKAQKQRYIHSVKGVAGNISANQLHSLIIQLEEKINNDEDLSEILPDIKKQLKYVVEEIREFCDKKKKTKKPQKKIDKEDIKKSISEIISMLEESDPNVLDKVNKLETYFKGKKEFEKILNLVKSYEFDKAIESIKNAVNQSNLN